MHPIRRTAPFPTALVVLVLLGHGRAAAQGTVPVTMTVGKTISAATVTLNWAASCDPLGTDYEVYEGTLGIWYSHAPIVCTDAAPFLTETFVPAAGNQYYLVVPRTLIDEGSYGLTHNFPLVDSQRPVGAPACFPQVLTCRKRSAAALLAEVVP